MGAAQTAPAVKQLELSPDAAAAGATSVTRALPRATRKFGKLVDVSTLCPGDLVLTREVAPDAISKLICKVQEDGGYAAPDARWTHAAMYVGDGLSVVEATFDSVAKGGDVRLTSLDEYCQGAHSLRFRRSNYLANEKDGWRVCVRALARMKRAYGLLEAAAMWFNVVFRKKGFHSSDLWLPTNSAVICSTLYADAYNEATRRTLGEVNGTCVPAWLSGSDEFADVGVSWASLA
jgi:hypothetical protein